MLLCRAPLAGALQVRGVDAIRALSLNLLTPYEPPAAPPPGSSNSLVEQLQARVRELEAQLAAAQGGGGAR